MSRDRVDAERLKATLGKPELQWVLDRLRRKLERGEPLEGRITLGAAARAQREAVSRLFGRPPSTAGSLHLKLADLEQLLRESEICPSLREAVECLTGPVPNRCEAQRALDEQWRQIINEAQDCVRGDGWLTAWIEGLEHRRIVRRLAREPADARELLESAIGIARHLPAHGVPLAELAATSTGDSHALDAGRPLATLLLLLAPDGDVPEGEAENARDAWARLGVLCDELSAPVLTLNLVARGDGVTPRALRLHAEAGEPYRLSTRQLLREVPDFAAAGSGTVCVCENPTVLAAAAAQLGTASSPLVCTEGQPRTACRLLLDRLVACGLTLAYHGDFDWPGIRIANLIYRRHGFKPWRFSAADYRSESGSLPLAGAPVETLWDADLTAAMIEAGHAIHEEQMLEILLRDLHK